MLGKKIKELRLEKGLTQTQLAQALSLTKQAISSWETDNSDPDLINLKILAKYFDITIDELMDNDEYNYNFESNYEQNGTKFMIKHKEKKKK